MLNLSGPSLTRNTVSDSKLTSQNLKSEILNLYDISSFKGPSFILPNGVIVSDDMWRSSLEMRLDDISDQSLHALRTFSLKDFIKEKIDLEGSDVQKKYYQKKQTWWQCSSLCKTIRYLFHP